jgi:hypothetical protein
MEKEKRLSPEEVHEANTKYLEKRERDCQHYTLAVAAFILIVFGLGVVAGWLMFL